MGRVRVRLIFLVSAAMLAASALPASATAAGHGGAVVPTTPSVAGPSGGPEIGQRPALRRTRVGGNERAHRFPVAGAYDLGGEETRFGAPRAGHRHQGQDILAMEETPVLAPWAGVVEFVRFQRSGAGWYVVLDGDREDRDYVFMHLRAGSILVAAGQHVGAGQPLAQVGRTGRASGPHLHFEIWAGGWYDGGEPVDPLPLITRWAGQA
jgi:murein DD-endopeptidase MepM/ murein hydrolase activator NlpD